MFKKLVILNLFLFFFSITPAEKLKIVYVNVDKIMQDSIAGKSIKKKTRKNLH